MQALPGDSQKYAENYQLPDIGRLKKELPRQRLLYQEGSLEQMKEAFADGVCFRAEIQQSIIDDDNIAVMALLHLVGFGAGYAPTYDSKRLGTACRNLSSAPFTGKTMFGFGEKQALFGGFSSTECRLSE